MAKNSFILFGYLFLLHRFVSEARGACSVTGNAHWFGPNCRYECHCEDSNEQCDETTGSCSSGCMAGWMGPGCQLINVAFNETAIQSSTIQGLDATRAIDGDPSTYTETKIESKPWWRLEFPELTYIQGIHLQIATKDVSYQVTKFNILIGNTTTQFSSCYSRDDGTEIPAMMAVQCDLPMAGRYLTIEGADEWNATLQIQEIQIYSECADGYWGGNCTQCGNCKDEELCSLDNGHCENGCKTGYKSPLCTECSEGYWGDVCHACGNCKDGVECNIDNGQCENGCTTGFKPPLCTGCTEGYWGDVCHACGNCKDGVECKIDNGQCEKGCTTGFKPPLCTECDTGYWGATCEPCGTCKDYEACNAESGHCENGCRIGYKPPYCNDCVTGYWGDKCQPCGRCKDDETCVRSTGHCEMGCAPGQKPPFCKDCEPGFWGDNCVACGRCKDETCDSKTGYCRNGCFSNYLSPLCKECKPGYWGYDCEPCGNCNVSIAVEVCDQTTGYCQHGCLDGYTPPLCRVPAPTTTQKISAQDQDKNKVGVVGIVGWVLAGFLFFGIVALLTLCLLRRRRKMKSHRLDSDLSDFEIKRDSETRSELQGFDNPVGQDEIDQSEEGRTTNAIQNSDNTSRNENRTERSESEHQKSSQEQNTYYQNELFPGLKEYDQFGLAKTLGKYDQFEHAEGSGNTKRTARVHVEEQTDVKEQGPENVKELNQKSSTSSAEDEESSEDSDSDTSEYAEYENVTILPNGTVLINSGPEMASPKPKPRSKAASTCTL